MFTTHESNTHKTYYYIYIYSMLTKTANCFLFHLLTLPQLYIAAIEINALLNKITFSLKFIDHE